MDQEFLGICVTFLGARLIFVVIGSLLKDQAFRPIVFLFYFDIPRLDV
jgi:hypothetical protein